MIHISGCTSAESTTGKLAFIQGDYEKAERELKKGLKIDKNDDEGWYMLGYSQIELGKFEEAEKSFITSLSISNSYAKDITNYWVSKYNDGAKRFKAGIKAEKKQDSVKAAKNFKSALDYFLASTHIIPDSLKSFKAAGECYLAIGEREEAMKIFQKILEKSKSEEDAIKVAAILFNAGLSMLEFEKYEDAAGTFQKVIEIEFLPKDNTYYQTSAYNFALSKAKIGEKVRDENPESTDHHPIFKEALTVLEPLAIAIEKNLDLKIQAYELLVAVYANLGENQKAQDALDIKMQLEKERDNNKQ